MLANASEEMGVTVDVNRSLLLRRLIKSKHLSQSISRRYKNKQNLNCVWRRKCKNKMERMQTLKSQSASKALIKSHEAKPKTFEPRYNAKYKHVTTTNHYLLDESDIFHWQQRHKRSKP